MNPSSGFDEKFDVFLNEMMERTLKARQEFYDLAVAFHKENCPSGRGDDPVCTSHFIKTISTTIEEALYQRDQMEKLKKENPNVHIIPLKPGQDPMEAMKEFMENGGTFDVPLRSGDAKDDNETSRPGFYL